jgi:glutamate carboxypeptidase
VTLDAGMVRAWPGMDSRAATAEVIAAATDALGAPIVAHERGGASDASHMAAGGIALTIDGLGPRGGGAHAPHEWVSAESLRTRAAVALAVTDALLAGAG